MTTLSELKELAGKAHDAAGIVGNAMAEKYPLGTDFERYNDEVRAMVMLCNEADELQRVIEVIEQCQGALNAAQTRVCNASVDKALQSIKDFGKE